jgi:hypothetical protein
MCRRFFRGNVVWPHRRWSPGAPIWVPQVRLKMRFAVGGGRFSPPIPCQWDTGAERSVISEQLARDLGFDLDCDPDIQMGGVTGVRVPAWLAPRYVRFPQLCGWQFKITFLVQQGADDPLPLLGMLDTYQNFDVVSNDSEYFFWLAARRHTGEAIPPDAGC